MKSTTLGTGLSLMALLKRPFTPKSGQSQIVGARAACLLTACIAIVSAQAGTISISYNLSGGPTGPPVVSGTTLILDGLFTGSVLSGNPVLNAAWNPVTYSDHSVADLTTGLLNGTFSITFANGDALFGNVFEDVSALVASGGTGPFSQTFTFSGGTGEFVGASGSTSGGGIATSTGSTVSGSGILTAAGVNAPEPGSVALFLGGLVAIVIKRRNILRQS
jgi:hypothetical protein